MKISKEMINPMIERLRSEIGYYIPISREYVVTEVRQYNHRHSQQRTTDTAVRNGELIVWLSSFLLRILLLLILNFNHIK